MVRRNMRCSHEHVKRLAQLGCPISEIVRISDYTKEQIEAILREDERPRPRTQAEQEADWIRQTGWSGHQ